MNIRHKQRSAPCDTGSPFDLCKTIVDAKGRLWYMGSHSGKLGIIERLND